MENMWQFKKVDMESKTPKELLREQADLLSPLTGDMVYARVTEATRLTPDYLAFYNDFNFDLTIRSRFLSNYQFRVLTISHGLPVYPIKVLVDDSIKEELQLKDPYYTVSNEDEFKSLLREILSSNRIGTVISSIIQHSK